jgi:hypothetical protein
VVWLVLVFRLGEYAWWGVGQEQERDTQTGAVLRVERGTGWLGWG